MSGETTLLEGMVPSLANAPEPAAKSILEPPCPSLFVSITDEHLVKCLLDADRVALVELLRRYGAQIRTLSLCILRDSGEADDLLQEVFLFVFRKASLFDPKMGSARSWIFQITYHRAFDRRRYLKSRKFYDAQELNQELHEVDLEHSSVEDRLIDRIDARGLLSKYSAYLSPDQSRTLELHFFQGYEFREIATETGQSLANVRNHYYRALNCLRSQLQRRKVEKLG